MTETIYALYPVLAASQELRAELFEDGALRNAAEEIETLYKDWAGRVDVRGSYSTVGFRADADLVLWLTSAAAEDSNGSWSSSGGPGRATSSIRSSR
jgi:chlorite dismutase